MANVHNGDVQLALLDEVAKHASQVLGSEHRLVPVDVGGNGHFPYNYKDSDNDFVYDTWAYLNHAVVGAGDGEVKFSDPLTNAYDSLITSLGFQLSTADRSALDQATIAAGQKTTDVVSQYEAVYGRITDQQKQDAGVDTKIDYIIGYKLGQWAKPNRIDLTPDNVRNLSDQLPSMPPSAKQLLPAISQFLGSMTGVLGLINAQNNANVLRRNLINNTEKPSADPHPWISNDKQPHPGFDIKASMAEIDSEIANDSSSFTITSRVESYDRDQAGVSIGGAAGVSVSLPGLIRVTARGATSYNLFDMNSEGTSCEIRATYKGVTGVPFMPVEYQEDSRSGWFDLAPLRDAVGNYDKDRHQNKDVTGWVFSPYPSNDQLLALDYLAISRLPEIEIRFFDGKASEHLTSLVHRSDVTISFFGIPLGSSSQQYSVSDIKKSADQRGFTVTFSPPALSGGALDQRAVVLGGELLTV